MSQVVSTGEFRRCFERAVGGTVLVRTLRPAAGGRRIIVSARVGRFNYRFRTARRRDPEVLRNSQRLIRPPAAHVWDGGAKVRLVATVARYHAAPKGTVPAVDPAQDSVPSLMDTAKRGSQELNVLLVAVVAIARWGRLCIARRARAASAIEGCGPTTTGDSREARTALFRSLDSLLDQFSPRTVVNFDVHGAELAMLRESSCVLSQSRPKWYCEVSFQTCADVNSVLAAAGNDSLDGVSYGAIDPLPVRLTMMNRVAIPTQHSDLDRNED